MPQCLMASVTIHETLNPEVCHCSLDIRLGVIESLPFIRQASPESRGFLSKNLRSEGMPEGREVSPLRYRNGVFGVVAQGAVKVYRFVGDDQVVIFDVLAAGDWFLYGGPDGQGIRLYQYPDQLSTLTTSCVLTMDRARFDPLLKSDPNLMAAFFGALTGRLTQANERFVRFMAFPADHRLAFLLDYLHGKGPKKAGYPGLIPFNLTRKDLAAMAGLTLETVSRILTAFEADGLVKSGRGWVEIVDFVGLRRRSHLVEV
jgi:CRP/FNR family transcriptional regulator, nitrogen oxide reductase regulator